MGTRSYISMLNQDGSVNSIYLHYDSYLSHAGKILNEFYNTPEAALGLTHGCGMSCIQPNYLNCRLYPKNDSDWKDNSYQELLKNADCCIEYYYLWKDNAWYVRVWDWMLNKVSREYKLSDAITKFDQGFDITHGDIVRELEDMGYSYDTINEAIKVLSEDKSLETASRSLILHRAIDVIKQLQHQFIN